MSWKLEAKSERLDSKVISVIVELVSSANENQLRFKEVHTGLVEKGLTTHTNQRKTALYLKRLVEKGVLEKLPTGAYAMKIDAKDFEAFTYLSWLKDQYGNRGLTESFGVGGVTWRESHGIIVPFIGQTTKSDEFLLRELETLLSSVFVALKDLRDKVLLQDSGYEAGYTQQTMRQGLVAIVANIVNREDISNHDVYTYLHQLTSKRKPAAIDKYGWLEMRYMNKGLAASMDLWKRAFYDIHGENSSNDEEDMWVSMLRQGGESVEEVKRLLQTEKSDLKKEGIEVDKISLLELRKQKMEFEKGIQRKMKQPKGKHLTSSYLFSPEEQQLASNLEKSIGIKWVEAFLKRGVDWEDFAVLVTTPPEIMSRYNTTLHDLKDRIEDWRKRTTIDEELLRYFASDLLYRDLAALRQPGVASILGITDDQLDKLIQYWQEFRAKWRRGLDEGLGNMARPQVELSKERIALLFADLKELSESSHDSSNPKGSNPRSVGG